MPSIKQQVEDHPLVYFFGTLLVGFMAGIGVYKFLLDVSGQTTVSRETLERLKSINYSPEHETNISSLSPSMNKLPIDVVIDNNKDHPNTASLVAPKKSEVITESSASGGGLTVQEITKKINDSTPFDKPNIESRFNGIKVEWFGWLNDVSTDDTSNIKVELLTKPIEKFDLHSIIFTTSLKKHPEFRVLEKGHKIRVSGVIIGANGPGLNVTLNPIEIETNLDNGRK